MSYYIKRDFDHAVFRWLSCPMKAKCWRLNNTSSFSDFLMILIKLNTSCEQEQKLVLWPGACFSTVKLFCSSFKPADQNYKIPPDVADD